MNDIDAHWEKLNFNFWEKRSLDLLKEIIESIIKDGKKWEVKSIVEKLNDEAFKKETSLSEKEYVSIRHVLLAKLGEK